MDFTFSRPLASNFGFTDIITLSQISKTFSRPWIFFLVLINFSFTSLIFLRFQLIHYGPDRFYCPSRKMIITPKVNFAKSLMFEYNILLLPQRCLGNLNQFERGHFLHLFFRKWRFFPILNLSASEKQIIAQNKLQFQFVLTCVLLLALKILFYRKGRN